MMAVEKQRGEVDDRYMPPVNLDPLETERLYREVSDAVYRSAYRITGRAEDAEDVLQTVFLRYLRRDASLGAVERPDHYLRRAGVNAALDLLRGRKNKVDLETLPQEPAGAATQELTLRLRQALARIDAKWAEMFVLRFVEGYGNREIAEMLGTSQTMVAVTLFRARQKLQGEIKLVSGSL